MMKSALVKIPEGSMILKEGETYPEMYKIIQGNVELYTGYGTEKEAILGIMSQGDYFGEMGLLTGKPSIYTAIAYRDLLLVRITEETIESYFERYRGDAYRIMKNIAENMYHLKYSMDMFVNELSDEKNDLKEHYRNQFSNRVAKYSVRGTAAGLNYDTRG